MFRLSLTLVAAMFAGASTIAIGWNAYGALAAAVTLLALDHAVDAAEKQQK